MILGHLRLKVMWIGLLLATVATAQDLRAPIDLTTPAVSVDQALTKLSDLSKVKLSVTADISTEPLILRFHQVSLAEAMQRIAEVVHAEWKAYGKGFLLERTPAMTKKLDDEAVKARAKGISEYIQQQLKDIDARGAWSTSRAMQMAKDLKTVAERADEDSQTTVQLRDELTERLPDYAAVWQMLAAMDPKDLAAVKPGERVAFSDMPGKMQHRLPQDILAVVPDWQSQHDELAADVKTLVPGGLKHESIPFFLPETPFSGKPARVTICISRPVAADMYRVDMLAFDDQNHPISTVTAYGGVRNVEGIKSLQDWWKDAPKDENPFDFNLASKQFLQASSTGVENLATGDLKRTILSPETLDPFTLVVSDALLQTASREDKNLAASPDDFLLELIRQAKYALGPGRSLTKSVLWALCLLAGTSVSEDGDWIVLKPTNPVDTSATRADRAALGNLLRTTTENGFVSIEDCAQAAASMRSRVKPTLFETFPFMLARKSDLPNGEGLDLLRFYATLGPIADLQSGQSKKIRVADLDSDQLSRLNEYIYEYENPGAMPASTASGRRYTEAEMHARAEPTEVWPDGLPSDGTITISPTDTLTYQVAFERDGSPNSQPMDLNQLVRLIAGSKAAFDPFKFEAKSLQPVKHRELTIEIQLGSSTRFGVLQQTMPLDKEYAIDKLPADLQTQLDQQVNEMVRGMESSKKSEPKPVPAPPTS